MTIPARDLIELTALALVVAVVVLATHLLWAGLAAGAVGLGYLAYVWDWEDAYIKLKRRHHEVQE